MSQLYRWYLHPKAWAHRIQVLITGNVTWYAADPEDEDEHEKLTRHLRWVILGPKPYTWWWVCKWGTREDGTYNPITGKQYTWAYNPNRLREWIESDTEDEWEEMEGR